MTMLSPGSLFLERYRVERLLGQGGFGEVYLARDGWTARAVAIKVLWGRFTDEALARFEREAKVVGRLRGPNVVRLFDYGLVDGSPYMITEFLDGESLRGLIDRGEVFEERRVRKLLAQVLEALVEAHSAGVLHRDIKPANIMLTADSGGADRAILIDFGIAKAAGEQRLTETGRVVGTVRYMAPEQLFGGAIGPAVDQFSLGLVAFELLTGRPWLVSDNPMEAASFHSRGVPCVLPATLDVSDDLRRLVMTLTSPNPEERFATASEALERLVVGSPGPARALDQSEARDLLGARGAILLAAVVLVLVVVLFQQVRWSPETEDDGSRSQPALSPTPYDFAVPSLPQRVVRDAHLQASLSLRGCRRPEVGEDLGRGFVVSDRVGKPGGPVVAVPAGFEAEWTSKLFGAFPEDELTVVTMRPRGERRSSDRSELHRPPLCIHEDTPVPVLHPTGSPLPPSARALVSATTDGVSAKASAAVGRADGLVSTLSAGRQFSLLAAFEARVRPADFSESEDAGPPARSPGLADHRDGSRATTPGGHPLQLETVRSTPGGALATPEHWLAPQRVRRVGGTPPAITNYRFESLVVVWGDGAAFQEEWELRRRDCSGSRPAAQWVVDDPGEQEAPSLACSQYTCLRERFVICRTPPRFPLDEWTNIEDAPPAPRPSDDVIAKVMKDFIEP